MKKTIILALILTGFLVFLNPNFSKVQAITLEELQAQIQQLFQIIQQLLAQRLQQSQGRYCFYSNLSYGMRSPEVKNLQIVLGVTPATGYFGDLTLAAVKKFQEEHNIKVTGKVGPETREVLNSLYCVSSQCGWCGQDCIRITPTTQCPDVMPPLGVECKEVNGVCTKVPSPSPATKKVNIVSPRGGATITSQSLPISWTLQGLTGNEGKVRILFYGGGDETSTASWQLVKDDLPLSSGSYTLDLTTVSISDPGRCKLRIGVYNPSTNTWVTWSQGSYTGQYYVDTSFSVQFTATKKVNIVSPRGGATITSQSLPISWTLQGFTGNEGKVRILFYGGGDETSTASWQLVKDDLPLSSGTYNLNLSNINITDPLRCQIRIGVYDPSTGNWLTWKQDPYTGQYYDDSGHFTILTATTPSYRKCSDGSVCTWCGNQCVKFTLEMQCPTVMPPQGATCTCVNNTCTVQYGSTSLMDILNKLSASLASLMELLKR